MNLCKHGHSDGAMHVPCYQCRAESLEEEALALKCADIYIQLRTALSDSNRKCEALERELAESQRKLGVAREALEEITPAFNSTRLIMNIREDREYAKEIVGRCQSALAQLSEKEEGGK